MWQAETYGQLSVVRLETDMSVVMSVLSQKQKQKTIHVLFFLKI